MLVVDVLRKGHITRRVLIMAIWVRKVEKLVKEKRREKYVEGQIVNNKIVSLFI